MLINIPSIFYSVLMVFKRFMPKRMLEKVAVCPSGADITKCPFIKSKFAVEDVPSFLGGKCKVRIDKVWVGFWPHSIAIWDF